LAKALGPGPVILNEPSNERLPDLNAASTAEREQSEAERDLLIKAKRKSSESELERKLYSSKAFKEHFYLDKVGRQRPVGLFKNKVAVSNQIFPGGSSAIDLIGSSRGTILVFELKKPGNIKVGVISELIFYTSVIRDAAGSGAPFQFPEARSAPGTTVRSSDIRGCIKIEAVLLHDDRHPLIGDEALFNRLNKAAGQHWNASFGRVPVKFRSTRFSEGHEDFAFKDM
jgi:hypothetical protein